MSNDFAPEQAIAALNSLKRLESYRRQLRKTAQLGTLPQYTEIEQKCDQYLKQIKNGNYTCLKSRNRNILY